MSSFCLNSGTNNASLARPPEHALSASCRLHRNQALQLVLLSKKPFEEAGHKTKWSGPPIIWARYGEYLNGLTIIGAHLPRPPSVTPQYLQVRELAKETLKVGDPVIVAGDFNATQWSYTLSAFQEFSGLWRLTSEPTWPTQFFGLAQFGIDHIFISNGVRPLAIPSAENMLDPIICPCPRVSWSCPRGEE